jgi:transcriptional regulator with XRE-family HTH domain
MGKRQLALISNLHLIRKVKKGWTQAKLADFLGVSQKLVSLIECGKRTVNQELDLKIRRLLDINES